MASSQTAQAWQYAGVSGGMEKNLKLTSIPMPTPKPDQHLIRVHAVGLNQVDYKITETPIIGRLAAGRPAIPGVEFSGEIVVPAKGSSLKQGQRVFGTPAHDVPAGHALAEYVLAKPDHIAILPDSISDVDAASLPVTIITAYQALKPYVKSGDRVFYNGGSGGVGLMAIQIAKILGAHITVTCSGRNVELVKSYGADEVIDYTKTDVKTALKGMPKFDHLVDGVGSDKSIFWQADQYSKPDAKYVYFAVGTSFAEVLFFAKANLLPKFLGGAKRKFVLLFAEPSTAQLEEVGQWVAEGKVKTAVDSTYSWEQAPEGYTKVKTNRVRGKVVVSVIKQ